MTDANLIEIFCILDEFCKYFAPELKKHTLDTCGKRRRNRPCLMSDSEVMTILVLFHTMRHRDLKSFYLGYVCNHMCTEFPHRLSYNRVIERQVKVDCIVCCSSRHAHWGNVREYPLSAPLH